MSSWSLAEYCAAAAAASSQRDDDNFEQQSFDYSSLPESSQAFLDQLGLPTVHPFCTSSAHLQQQEQAQAFLLNDSIRIPPMGRLQEPIHDSVGEAIVTLLYMYVPPLWAVANLWFRLVCGIMAPLGLLWMMMMLLLRNNKNNNNNKFLFFQENRHRFTSMIVALATVVSSLVVMTDSGYVYEFGSQTGLVLFVLSLCLATRLVIIIITTTTTPLEEEEEQQQEQKRRCSQFWKSSKTTPATAAALLVVVAAVVVALVLVWDPRNGIHFGDPVELDIQVDAGLYYDQTNKLINATIMEYWPQEKRTYTRPTRWMYTGDMRTGLPFYLNPTPQIDWKRVFLTLSDGEVLALDISFPPQGHNTNKPVYMVLHGINGGSTEGYVQDFAKRQYMAGSTVVVMVSRGLMDLPIKGMNIFHDARWTDAHEAAQALKRAMMMSNNKNQILAGVGYSMGAIVLNNYVASSGSDCALDAAFSISGALECRHELTFYRTHRLWHPMISDFMRSTQHLAKWAERMKARLGRDDMIAMMRSTNVIEIDQYIGVKYNGFRDLQHYYAAMGAMGDIPLEQQRLPLNLTKTKTKSAKIFNIAIPLCVLHSFDDPISTWRTIVGNEGMVRPEELVRASHGNLILLLTDKGGHVGWPTGWFPFWHGWEFMNEAASSFVEAVAQARAETGTNCAKRLKSGNKNNNTIRKLGRWSLKTIPSFIQSQFDALMSNVDKIVVRLGSD